MIMNIKDITMKTMYRNLIYALLAAFTLAATSCVYEDIDASSPAEEAKVTFSLGLEKTIATRAISDGTQADRLVYAIYKIDAAGAPVLQEITGSVDGQVVVDDFASGMNVIASLAKGQTYRIAFWAQDSDCTAYDTQDLTNVKVDYNAAANNDESRDAFWATLQFVAVADATYDVTLRRPFAQVNVGVIEEDWTAALASLFEVGESAAVIRNAATSMNLLTGEVGEETTDVEVSYAAAAIPDEPLFVNTDETTEEPEEYVWLSTSYILVADRGGVADENGILGGAGATLESAEFTFVPKVEGTAIVLKDGLTNVPVQRNWRTNVLGRVLTGDVNFTITVDPSYYNDYTTIRLAEGVRYDAKEGTYYIEGAEGLLWISNNLEENNGFEGVTIKLESDVDLYEEDENGEPVCFDPIGSYRFDEGFKGTFDGQDHTISNMNQNTWALDNGYYYNDCGLGLFGQLEGATVKNLKVDNASISGESALCGVVAAIAHNTTFENVTVSNSDCADYQYYAGGIVGWASGESNFINCNVDATTNVAAQWGDFDNSIGGVIGGASSSAVILMKDCNIACRIDAYNDVTSTYQYYAYRRAGMLIGNSGATKEVDGTTYADAPQLTCENVTVTYGEWAYYTYCEFAGTSWPYVRVQAGVSNSAYSNPRYGHPTDADGNEVVDDNHVHNEGEDHHILLQFDQLYGGGTGVYGTKTHEGVTVVYPAPYNPES